jgi:hypothetical protein
MAAEAALAQNPKLTKNTENTAQTSAPLLFFQTLISLSPSLQCLDTELSSLMLPSASVETRLKLGQNVERQNLKTSNNFKRLQNFHSSVT